MAAPKASGPTNGRHRRTFTSTLISTSTNVPRKYERKCSGRKRGNGRPFRRKNRAVGQASQARQRRGERSVHPKGGSRCDPLHRCSDRGSSLVGLDPGVDGRSLQQWRSIQVSHWLALQKVQHSIQQTLEQSRDPGRRRPCWSN